MGISLCPLNTFNLAFLYILLEEMSKLTMETKFSSDVTFHIQTRTSDSTIEQLILNTRPRKKWFKMSRCQFNCRFPRPSVAKTTGFGQA